MTATVRLSHRPTDEKRRLGARLRAARIVSRISQRDLSNAYPYSRTFLAECERGLRPVPEELQRWAERVLRLRGGPGNSEAVP